MSGRLPLRWSLGLALALALLALLAVGVVGDRAPAASVTVPTVAITFADQPFGALFARPNGDDDRPTLTVGCRDVDGQDRKAKATLRGFSNWHHTRSKPSLRVKYEDEQSGAESIVELSRPEDPLTICNWLPDQLGAALGLLHEHSAPVRLLLDGRDFGLYHRSLRPGDELSRAAARPRGTFFKGDSLGARSHLDLWADPASWRTAGADEPRAGIALAALLATLREPASPAAWDRLALVLDLERAAAVAAVAALVGSIHADAVHNHVLFYDPSRQRLEPLLWDANGFGIHAEPDLAVDVARHPLAARLLCQPEFVHRRNELLWQLLTGPGHATALLAAVDRRLEQLDPVLRSDPEIARLALRSGVFTVETLAYAELPAARAGFARFVQRRQAVLTAWFDQAMVAVEPIVGNERQSRVTVFGHVAVAVHRTDMGTIRGADGRSVTVLWPGLTQALTDVRQHQDKDGRGVSAPFAGPAPLTYALDCPPAALTFTNAFTGAVVAPSTVPPAIAAAPSRSLHPWTFPPPPSGALTLGPGSVRIDTPLVVPAGATLRIARGTQLELAAAIRCEGDLEALGTAGQPIQLRCDGAGLLCVGGSVRLQHCEILDLLPWRGVDGGDDALLHLGNCVAELEHCRLLRASGVALAIVGGRVGLRDTEITRGHGTAIMASADATVLAENLTIQFARRAVIARDGARLQWRNGTLRGHRVGVRAERSVPGFAGAFVSLTDVDCGDTGLFDVDCDAASTVHLIGTRATANPLAAGQILRDPLPQALPAAPR